MPRNPRPDQIGMGGRITPEYAFIVFQIFDFQKVIENPLRCPICKFSILNFLERIRNLFWNYNRNL